MEEQILSSFTERNYEEQATWQIAANLDIPTSKARRILKGMEIKGLVIRSPRFKWSVKNNLVWCLPSLYAK